MRLSKHDRKVLFARKMRMNMTPAEKLLHESIKDCQLGYHFMPQAPLIGYIVDFYCKAKKLVIEVDGGYHLQPKQKKADERREFHLEQAGLTIMRFDNERVLSDLEGVLAEICRELGYVKPPIPAITGVASDWLW